MSSAWSSATRPRTSRSPGRTRPRNRPAIRGRRRTSRSRSNPRPAQQGLGTPARRLASDRPDGRTNQERSVVHPPTTPRIRPGDLLIHPVAVLAVVVLVINDHVLKSTFPGLVTGKLSDVAGLVFFPLLLASVVELAALARRRTPPNRRRLVVGSIVATGLMFVVVKTTVVGSMAFGWSLGVAQWLAGAGPLRGVAPMPAAVAVDPGDLVALAGLIGAWFVAGGPQGAELRPRLDRAGRPPSRRATAMLLAASLATMATGGASVRG